MKISHIHISNFIAIKELDINDIENALILVGKNNTGKTIVIDAIRAVVGDYKVKERDFLNPDKNITIGIEVEFTEQDLRRFNSKGIVSKYKKYDKWLLEFMQKLPSFRDGVLKFECKINRHGTVKYDDGFKRNNIYIKEVFPKIYHIDHSRNFENITNDILALYDSQALLDLRENVCMFDRARKCHKCFNCIGLINKKEPKELTAFEAARLLEYKLLNINLKEFQGRVNKYLAINGSRSQEILFDMKFKIVSPK